MMLFSSEFGAVLVAPSGTAGTTRPGLESRTLRAKCVELDADGAASMTEYVMG